jgi:hypothetical protein
MRTLARLVSDLKAAKDKTGSWSKASVVCNVLLENGKPDPGLAYRIAEQGYEPKTVKVCRRINIPTYCKVCERTAPRHREKILDPSPALTYTRARNAQANEVARAKGYKNWSQMMTAMIDLYYSDKKG